MLNHLNSALKADCQYILQIFIMEVVLNLRYCSFYTFMLGILLMQTGHEEHSCNIYLDFVMRANVTVCW